MKKISSVILAVMILAMSFVSISVSAFGVDDISVFVNVYSISATAVAETAGTMTAKLTSNDGDTLYAMKSDRIPEEVTVGNAVKYKYEFSFRMGADVPTGTYMITVGNNVDSTEKTFPYVRLGDKIEFYDGLNAKSADEISQFFAENASTVPVDLTTYNALTPDHTDVLALVNEEIVNLNLATGVTETDTAEEKAQKVSAVDLLFTTEFSRLMEIAAIASVEEENWAEFATSKLGTIFDGKFYDEELEGALAIADVYDNFAKESALVSEFTQDAYGVAFDKATLMEIEQTRSFGVLKDAFLYFENKGIITPDMTDINALIAADKDAQLWKDLIEKENTSCAMLIENAESIADDLNVPLTDGNTGSNIGGSSLPADKPTGSGGGGSLGGGGGSSKPTKPTEPKPEEPKEPETSKVTFTDIDTVDWAKDAIKALAEKGVINGKSEGIYAPDDKVTREEFVKIIIGAFDLLNEDAGADFGDVDVSRWSYAFIATANELGIVSGDGVNFNPTSEISRQDMAVVLYRTAEKLGIKLSGDAESFKDSDDIADYAKEAVKALTAGGIINGMGDGTFAPKATVTRAQAAKVIYGLMSLVGGGK